MKFCSDVIMWTALTVALPYTTLALPVPYSAPSAPDSDEHLLRTAAFSSSSSLSSSSSSSVVDSVKPSFSLASSTVSSSSFSNGRAVIMLASSGTSFSREKRERTGRVPRSLEQTNSEILQKAGADPQVPGSANPLATSVPPPILRHHRKNQAPKKRPSSKKRRRRRKCPKKDQKQRRRKHRKCSRKSKRNGRKKKKKKKNRNKNGRKGKKRGKKKRRRRVTEGGSKNVTSDKREVVTAQDVVNAPKATPSSVLPSQVASLFDSASPLKPVEQKDPKEKPSRPLAELASAYDSSRPLLSANHFKNLQHNRHSHQTPPSKSKHERVRRSIAVLLRRLSSENDGYGDETNLLDERTRVFETLSSLLRQKSNVQRTSLPQILNEQYFGKL